MPPSDRASRDVAKAALYATYSQLVFFATVALCMALTPYPLKDHLGLSYYGTVGITLVPYMIGLLLTGYFMAKAAHALPRGDGTLRVLSEVLLVLAILVVGICLTPYRLDALMDWAHFVTSAVLFIVELGLAFWLVWGLRRRALNAALLALQAAGAGIALASETHRLHLIFVGELMTQFAFGILLIHCLWQLARAVEPPLQS